jgi:FKBP-type peptidyl-prolyl cis-trans isomerase
MKYSVILLASLLILNSCWKTEYEPQASGLLFKLLTFSDSPKRIQSNHFVQFKIASPITKDSTLSKRLFIQVPEKSMKGGIIEALSLLKEGESGRFKTPVIKIERNILKMTEWQHWRGDSLVTFEITIDKIFSPDEFEKSKANFINWLRQEEVTATIFEKETVEMNAYEQNQAVSFEKTKSGLRYRKLKETNQTQTRFGTFVKIRYEGRFLDGYVFDDTYSKRDPLDFYIGQELQVLRGVEEALLLMKEGEELEVILPSWLAYGKTGSSTGIVPPNTPLVYKITLLEVY